jgi:hypothetical protein
MEAISGISSNVFVLVAYDRTGILYRSPSSEDVLVPVPGDLCRATSVGPSDRLKQTGVTQEHPFALQQAHGYDRSRTSLACFPLWLQAAGCTAQPAGSSH